MLAFEWTPEFIGALSTAIVAVLSAIGLLLVRWKPTLERWWQHQLDLRKQKAEEAKLKRADDLNERERMLTIRMMENKEAGPAETLKYLIRKQDRENRDLKMELTQVRNHFENEINLVRGNYMNCLQEHAQAKAEVNMLKADNQRFQDSNDRLANEVDRLKARLKINGNEVEYEEEDGSDK